MITRLRTLILGCCVTTLGAAGCASSFPYTYGSRLKETSLQQLQRGETTKEQIVELFGKPREVIHGADGMQEFIYESVHVEGKFVSFFTPSAVDKQHVKRLRVTLDAAGRLHDYTIDELYREVEPLVDPGAISPGGPVQLQQQQSSYSGYRH
ncbi:MAG: hypothetical protein HYZ89_04815 [Candidatus Omnitrophica bacterium]|nr:hypothetical protein [Candidatus Omnitrophota bacterium]